MPIALADGRGAVVLAGGPLPVGALPVGLLAELLLADALLTEDTGADRPADAVVAAGEAD